MKWNLVHKKLSRVSTRITFSSSRHPVVVQVGQDLLGQVVAQGQLLQVRVERRPASAPKTFQRRFRRRRDRRRRRFRISGLFVVVGREFRNWAEVVRPDRLNPESVRIVPVSVSARLVGGSTHCFGFTVNLDSILKPLVTSICLRMQWNCFSNHWKIMSRNWTTVDGFIWAIDEWVLYGSERR